MCRRAATLIALRDRGEPLPAAGVCLSPWVDLEGIGESMTTKADADPMVQKDGLQRMAAAYLGGADPRSALAAPLYAELQGLPPLLIQVGTAETLLDDSTRITARARDAGVDVTLEPWEEMIHVWQMFVPVVPEARQAVERRIQALGLEGLADGDRLVLAFLVARLVRLWNRVGGLGPGRTFNV